MFEYWMHPLHYRTRMCKDRERCKRHYCFFAHADEQLRLPSTAPVQAAKAALAAAAASTGLPNDGDQLPYLLLQAHTAPVAGMDTPQAVTNPGPAGQGLLLPASLSLSQQTVGDCSDKLTTYGGSTIGYVTSSHNNMCMTLGNLQQTTAPLMHQPVALPTAPVPVVPGPQQGLLSHGTAAVPATQLLLACQTQVPWLSSTPIVAAGAPSGVHSTDVALHLQQMHLGRGLLSLPMNTGSLLGSGSSQMLGITEAATAVPQIPGAILDDTLPSQLLQQQLHYQQQQLQQQVPPAPAHWSTSAGSASDLLLQQQQLMQGVASGMLFGAHSG